MKPHRLIIAQLALCICIFGQTLFAQSTEFSYQGSLRDGAAQANGNYDFEFRLFDAPAAGTQHPTVVTRTNVPVSNGIFKVTLDFFSALTGAFPGADRYLEIRVRSAGGPTYTLLTPRQKIASEPYSQKSLNSDSAATATNSLQLGGVAASQYVTNSSGGTSYIQNSASQQAGSNFNISGDGTVGGSFRAASVSSSGSFRINDNPILSINPFLNTFLGINAGSSITNGVGNSFFGNNAGGANTGGGNNAFFGRAAGSNNTTASSNSFFGNSAGAANTTGFQNVFLGASAGSQNTIADKNVFVGYQAGNLNTTGNSNTFIGTLAGNSVTSGSSNTAIGDSSDVIGSNLSFATAIGAGAVATESNTIVIGRAADTVKIAVLSVVGGSDLAEKFETAGRADPGMILEIDPKNAGKLVVSRGAYNRRVAGVVSGANNLSVGMTLPDVANAKDAQPVALSGRVWVYADATVNAITPGDLLTTSETPGYAMKVTDHKRAQGAIIGKAMTELKSGKGFVLVLVTLQ